MNHLKKQRAYTLEFKEEAVKLALTSASYAQAANALGIPKDTLYGWINQAKNKPSKAGSTLNSAHLIEENKRLAKALAQAQEEAAILKKAAAYFAQHLK